MRLNPDMAVKILALILVALIGLLIGQDHPTRLKQNRYRIDGAACAVLLWQERITGDQFGAYMNGESYFEWHMYDSLMGRSTP